MLDLTQLIRVPRVDAGFDISPDGTHLAFAWNKTGEWHIYELELGSDLTLPQRSQRTLSIFSENSVHSVAEKQLTSGIGGKLNPRYSPDGTRLAYALDFDEVKVTISLSITESQANTRISHQTSHTHCSLTFAGLLMEASSRSSATSMDISARTSYLQREASRN